MSRVDTECVDHGLKPSNKLGHAKSRGEWVHRRTFREAHNLSREDIQGKVVRHTCDNARCIEVTHLILGTKADNNRDMAVRGRASQGDGHAHAKLSREVVKEMRRRYTPGCRVDGLSALAREFGVTVGTAHPAIHGKTWRENGY